MKLHPGAAVALRRMKMDELDIAEAIRDGDLASPQRYENVSLVEMRVTGTGVSYRRKLKEFVMRDPEIYLNERFLRRCQGLPVILEHPKTNSLNSEEFNERVVGSVFLPFIRDADVWCITKIYDDSARDLIDEERLSTSPCVVFRDQSVNEKKTLDDGTVVLVEGEPSLLDHLAICERGVWDKGGVPSGVTSVTYGDSNVTDEEKAAAAAKADADTGAKLDKVLSYMDSLSTRMDSFEEKFAKKDTAKKDGDPDPAKDAPTETVTDKAVKKDGEGDDKVLTEEEKAAKKAAEEEAAAKKDADEKKAAEEEAAAKKDANEMEGIKKKIDDMDKKMPKEMSDADFEQMADAQAKADSVASLFGKSASRPLNGETLLAYRKRQARSFQAHSGTWKDVDIFTLPKAAFEIAEAQIYSDAQVAARTPTDLAVGTMREIRQMDRAGRQVSTFHGDMDAWMGDFKLPKRRLIGINKEV